MKQMKPLLASIAGSESDTYARMSLQHMLIPCFCINRKKETRNHGPWLLSSLSVSIKTLMLAIFLMLFILPAGSGNPGVSTVRPDNMYYGDKCKGYPGNGDDSTCNTLNDTTAILTDGINATYDSIYTNGGNNGAHFITINRTGADPGQSGDIQLILYIGYVNYPTTALDVLAYQRDASNINTTAGDIQFIADDYANNTIDITDMAHSMDGYGFYKLRVDVVSPQTDNISDIAEVWLKEYRGNLDSYTSAGCSMQNDIFYNSGNAITVNVCGNFFVPLKTYDVAVYYPNNTRACFQSVQADAGGRIDFPCTAQKAEGYWHSQVFNKSKAPLTYNPNASYKRAEDSSGCSGMCAFNVPSLIDTRDSSPPSDEGYWYVNEGVYLNGTGWDSFQTIMINIKDPYEITIANSNITADANGNIINQYIDLGPDYARGIYSVNVSTDGGSTWTEHDTFTVYGIKWYRPSYPGALIGSTGDIITVTVINDDKPIKWANFTWKYPNGSVARISGSVRAHAGERISDNFVPSVTGIWRIEVQFATNREEPSPWGFSFSTFTIGNRIALSADPLVIMANGVSKSTITADVTTVFGSPVADNVVTFTTDLGTLSNGTVSAATVTAKTGANGHAIVNLTSTTNGTATVTGTESSGRSNFVKVGATVNYIVLSSNPEEILADGTAKSMITAKVTTDGTNPIADNLVNFTTDLGTLSNGTVSGVMTLTKKTDSNGLAVINLTSSMTTGIANITAKETAGGTDSGIVSFINVSTFNDVLFNISQTEFPKLQSVFIESKGLASDNMYYFMWYYPNGTLTRQSPILTGSLSQTDSFEIQSDAQEGSNWTVNLMRYRESGDILILQDIFTVVQTATINTTRTGQGVNDQVNATTATQANPSGAVNANFTWIAPNGTIARSVIQPATLMPLGATDSFFPGIDGIWTLNVSFLNENNNEIDFNSTTFDVITCSIALGQSFSEIGWSVSSIPVANQPAMGNNGSGITQYNISIITSACTADVYIRADGDLTTGTDVIGLNNESYRASTTDSTVPGMTYTPLGTTYTGNQIGSNLGNGTYIYIKLFLSVPGSQPAGNYNNTVHIKGVKHGTVP